MSPLDQRDTYAWQLSLMPSEKVRLNSEFGSTKAQFLFLN